MVAQLLIRGQVTTLPNVNIDELMAVFNRHGVKIRTWTVTDDLVQVEVVHPERLGNLLMRSRR